MTAASSPRSSPAAFCGGRALERRELTTDVATHSAPERAITAQVPAAAATKPPAAMPPNNATVPTTDAIVLAVNSSMSVGAVPGPCARSSAAPTTRGITAVVVAWKSRLPENTMSAPAKTAPPPIPGSASSAAAARTSGRTTRMGRRGQRSTKTPANGSSSANGSRVRAVATANPRTVSCDSGRKTTALKIPARKAPSAT